MKRHILLPLLSIACCAALSAQDLEKEITIDRDIVPVRRAASRPVVFPSVLAPKAESVTLRMGQAESLPAISPLIAAYEPAATLPAFAPTPWRGYFDLGYFPAVNLGVSAGYTIIDTKATALNVWLQADNRNYKDIDRSYDTGYDFKWKSLDLSAGVRLSQRFNGGNRLLISTDVAYSSWSVPAMKEPSSHGGFLAYAPAGSADLSNLRWHIDADFLGKTAGRFSYTAGASFGIYHNGGEPLPIERSAYRTLPNLPSVNTTSFGFRASGSYRTSARTSLNLSADARFLNYNHFTDPVLMADYVRWQSGIIPGSESLGQIDITPSFDFNNGSFYGKVGARLGISVNSGNSFHIAPDILAGVNPSQMFGFWLRLGGGVYMNSPEDLYDISRYGDPRLAYGFSNIPFTGQLGLRVGPFKGASLTVTADYAAANDWLTPVVMTYGDNIFYGYRPSRIRAFRIGANIDWSYREICTFALNYAGRIGGSDDNRWLTWHDGARHVAGATVSFSPKMLEVLSPLTVEVGITARINRQQKIDDFRGPLLSNTGDNALSEFSLLSTADLGDMTDLHAGATWSFSPAFSIFARFDNLLNRRDKLVFLIPSQGFTGLFGLNYKF